MKKKDLKVVDINDLQPETESFKIQNQHEEEVIGKVSVDDLNTTSNNEFITVHSKLKKVTGELATVNGRKIDSSIINGPRFKKYQGNGSSESVLKFMSSKYRFDKRLYNKRNVFLLVVMFVLGFGYRFVQEDFEFFFNQKEGISTIFLNIISSFYVMYTKIYIAVILVFLYFFPLKTGSDSMVEIFYDGISIPCEVFPIGRSKRKRISWKQVYRLEYKKRYNTPFVQVISNKDEVIGEIRLDVDYLKRFYDILDTYCPEDNPLRNLFNNSRKS